MESPLSTLIEEYDRALGYTDSLVHDLDESDLHRRPHDDFSPIAWHLGHQAAVAHYMLRNLIAAEASPDPALDALMDSATPERDRGGAIDSLPVLPDAARLQTFRSAVAARIRERVAAIPASTAPRQLDVIARGLMVAITNHEYQHSEWIAEVRRDLLGRPLPPRPTSPSIVTIDGYLVLAAR